MVTEDLPIVPPVGEKALGAERRITRAAGAEPRPLRLASREILAPWLFAIAGPGRGKDAKELLGNVRLFSTCNKRELARIASSSTRSKPKGKVLVRQGDPGEECFVIAEGKAKATMRQGPRCSGPARSSVRCHCSIKGLGRRPSPPRPICGSWCSAPRVLRLDQRGAPVAVRIMQGLAERLRVAEPRQPQH